MNTVRRTAALLCIGLLSLALAAPLAASEPSTTSEPSLTQLLWDWLVSALGNDEGGGGDPDGGGLQIPPGTP